MQPQRNWRDLIKPKGLDMEDKNITASYGKFVGEPFERGFGTTIGNALRRILLSSLQGAAISALRASREKRRSNACARATKSLTAAASSRSACASASSVGTWRDSTR